MKKRLKIGKPKDADPAFFHIWLRKQGEAAARAGKPIESYYDLPLKRHNEGSRAEFEIGYRATAEELRKQKKCCQICLAEIQGTRAVSDDKWRNSKGIVIAVVHGVGYAHKSCIEQPKEKS